MVRKPQGGGGVLGGGGNNNIRPFDGPSEKKPDEVLEAPGGKIRERRLKLSGLTPLRKAFSSG